MAMRRGGDRWKKGIHKTSEPVALLLNLLESFCFGERSVAGASEVKTSEAMLQACAGGGYGLSADAET